MQETRCDEKPEAIKASDLRRLLESQGYSCALTGELLTPETATLDHIVPLARGGDHALENLWVLHARVNTAKGTMLVEEFLEMCRQAVGLADRKASGSHPGV